MLQNVGLGKLDRDISNKLLYSNTESNSDYGKTYEKNHGAALKDDVAADASLLMKKKYTYLIVIFLIIASFAAFGRIAGNDFISFDDPGYINENYHVQSGISLQNIKWASTAVVLSNWHPVTLLSHMLDWSLFGANASGHHLVSLLMHIGAVLFLFFFLNKKEKKSQ